MTLRLGLRINVRRLAVLSACLFVWLPAALTVSAVAGENLPQSNPVSSPVRNLVWLYDPWTRASARATYLEPDFSLWDASQVHDYQAALGETFPPPLGILFINDLNIQVPIWNGADEHILDRGAGRIRGMGRMSGNGKLGISAHRDSFFRGLKDIEPGDEILVQSANGVEKFAVTDIRIVPKEDTSVLAPVDHRELMLVTCHPFYHVGAAPDRFIVTALPVPDTVE